jgi:hypothetical protein
MPAGSAASTAAIDDHGHQQFVSAQAVLQGLSISYELALLTGMRNCQNFLL